uniref:Uncharacterized protein n=1 Tax=Panagrellus redivivus TaxID=6233 RepID=A0A7E4UXC4_PANRE
MNRKNSMLEALKHEHQLCSCGSTSGPPGGLGHDDKQCGFGVIGSNDYINEEPEVNPLISSTSLASVVSPMPSSGASNSPNRFTFHRKFQSEENHLIKSASTTFSSHR